MADSQLTNEQLLWQQVGEAYDHLRGKTVLSGCTSYVQRMLQCGYNRAAAIFEILENSGVISLPDSDGQRHWRVDEAAGRALIDTAARRALSTKAKP